MEAQNVLHLNPCVQACMDMSHHGLSQPLKDSRAVVNGLIGIKNALVKCLFISKWC